jgi:hypothetical protein
VWHPKLSKFLGSGFSVASLWARDSVRVRSLADLAAGHSLRHIATTLGVGYGTVRTRLQRVG